MRKFLFFTCIIAMTFIGLRLIPGQSTQLPVSVIWNRVIDTATGEIQTAPWAWAQGTNLSVAELLNLVFRSEGNYLAISGGVGGEGDPGPNSVGTLQAVDDSLTGTDIDEGTLVLTGLVGTGDLISTGVVAGDYGTVTDVASFTVSAGGTLSAAANVPIALPLSAMTWIDHITTPPEAGNVLSWDAEISKYIPRPNSSSSSIIGITGTPSGIDSIHFNTITLTDTCGLLGTVSKVDVIAGASGETCILPPASLSTTPDYTVRVINTNVLSMSPSGTDTINGENAPLGPIRGPLGRFKCERRSDTAWHCDVDSITGFGEPITSMCASVGGSTNTSSSGSGSWHQHSLTCLIPANTISTGTQLKVCAVARLITGSSPPTVKTRFSANSTVIWEQAGAETLYTTNAPGYTARQCISVTGAGPPSATASLYTAAAFAMVANSQYPAVSSIIGDPVTVDTTVDNIFTYSSFFTTAGTGTTSIEEMAFDVEGARFAN